MKNKEYFKDQIYDILCSCKSVAVNSKTGEPFMCDRYSCANCALFRADGTCKTRAFMNWLDEEHKKHVLTYEEKRYLENFIRPFRSQVKSITKRVICNDYADLYIDVESIIGSVFDDFALPTFGKNDAYLGMEFDRDYTIERLGLFEKEEKNENQN